MIMAISDDLYLRSLCDQSARCHRLAELMPGDPLHFHALACELEAEALAEVRRQLDCGNVVAFPD